MLNNVSLLNRGMDAKTLWSDLDGFYSKIEKEIFNPIGYIPLVGTLSGSCRIVYGLAQSTISSFGIFFENWCGLLTSDRANSIRHYDGGGAAMEHSVHGILNVIRGTVELCPLLPLITCLPLDASGYKFSYRTELGDYKIVPIQDKDFMEAPIHTINPGFMDD
jgi:hypothetical protein